MALTRTDTELLLESDDASFYQNALVDHGSDIVVPTADDTDPQADDGSDGYVPIVADDGQVWRWKNYSQSISSTLTVQHDITVSPNQSETLAETVSIKLGSVWYDVSIEVVDDGSGNDVPLLISEANPGAASGSTSLTFSTSGTLTGTGALSGSSSLTFSTAGTLAGAGALSGSTTLTFTASGNMGAPGEMSGSSSLTFSASGTLSGAGAMSGASTLTFSTAGVLSGTGALSGASSLTFTASGTGSISGTVQISGSSTLTFSVSGTLTDASIESAITYSTGAMSGFWYS